MKNPKYIYAIYVDGNGEVIADKCPVIYYNEYIVYYKSSRNNMHLESEYTNKVKSNIGELRYPSNWTQCIWDLKEEELQHVQLLGSRARYEELKWRIPKSEQRLTELQKDIEVKKKEFEALEKMLTDLGIIL